MGEKTGIAWCDHTFNPWIDGKLVKMPELDGIVWDQFPGVAK